MVHLISTTDSVRLSFLLALLRDAGIKTHVFDANISALVAGLGAFPRRIMVPTKWLLAAKTLLEDANEFYDD
jgi:hypothetical protein